MTMIITVEVGQVGVGEEGGEEGRKEGGRKEGREGGREIYGAESVAFDFFFFPLFRCRPVEYSESSLPPSLPPSLPLSHIHIQMPSYTPSSFRQHHHSCHLPPSLPPSLPGGEERKRGRGRKPLPV